MRTTLQIDDDVLAAAKARAQARSESVGKALSELARKGARIEMPVKRVGGLVVFQLPADSPPVTMDLVRRLEGEPR
ncbi:MAG: hypothetical protein NEA02_12955 [Thermoanaerobaculia bacterium]|nr:hypothetical protein [Thermoanaerobaculia bacterium]